MAEAFMNTFIALYRGINVGGHHPVKMDSLRALHAGLGHEAAESYIQSGNLVFRANDTTVGITRAVSAAFATEFGFAATLLVRTAAEWSMFVAENPYAKAAAADPTKVHAAICDGVPNKKSLAALLEKTGGPEAFAVNKGILYLHAPDGVGRSKFAAGLERACGVPATLRNWRTMEALQEMAKRIASE
jgi:uncharacterized protein (DUF1697 family)